MSSQGITWNHFDLATVQMLEEDGSWVDSAQLCKGVLFRTSHRNHFRWQPVVTSPLLSYMMVKDNGASVLGSSMATLSSTPVYIMWIPACTV